MDLVNDIIASNEVSILPRTLQCMYIATDSLEHQLTTSSVKKYGLNMLGKPIILPPRRPFANLATNKVQSRPMIK